MIIASNLRKSYGSLTAVDEISFEISAGETFGLLGPNGAGKSTTINMLVGLTDPDGGTVSISGNNGRPGGGPEQSEMRRRIGIAPQSLSLYEELSAEENLNFFGSLYGLSGSELASRTDEAIEIAGLNDRRRDLVSTYSGGMKRRLNIATALIHGPEILLLDEPTVGVDPQSRNHIFESIERLSERGLTVIYTTHYMEEAQRLCDRVAIMDHGRLLALDTVDQLIEQHGGSSHVVAEFTGELPELLPDDIQQPIRQQQRIEFESSQPLESVASLSRSGIELHSLNILRPNLESVFLSLTGRSLRD